MGVLATLEDAGIPIDVVAGTSGGALVGALYCAGLRAADLSRVAARTGWWQLASPVWPSRGFISFDPLERWLIRLIGDATFADLRMPFAVMATDIDRGEPVMLRSGRVAPAVRASSSVPGLVTPAFIDGHRLVDGGISDNVPVHAAHELGAQFVIGVDVFAHVVRPRLGPLGYGIAAIEVMVRQSGGGTRRADLLITPVLAGVSYVRMQSAHLIELGRRAAEAALPALRVLLSLPAPASISATP